MEFCASVFKGNYFLYYIYTLIIFFVTISLYKQFITLRKKMIFINY